MPMLSVGAISVPARSDTPRATVSGQMASVPIRPLGPCCSVDPMGMMIPRDDCR